MNKLYRYFIAVLIILGTFSNYYGKEIHEIIKESFTGIDVFTTYYPFRIVPQDSPLKPKYRRTGWTPEFIDRDILNMSRIGINGVILGVDPRDLSDAQKLEMIKAFLGVLSVQHTDFRFILHIAPEVRMQLDYSNIYQFLKKKELINHPLYFHGKANNKLVVFYNENALFKDSVFEEAKFVFLQSSQRINQTDPRSTANLYLDMTPLFSPDFHMKPVVLYSGYKECYSQESEYERALKIFSKRKPDLLQIAIKNIIEIHPNMLILCSWNDYISGSIWEQ